MTLRVSTSRLATLLALAAVSGGVLTGCGGRPEIIERACAEVEHMTDLAPDSREYLDRQREGLAMLDQYLVDDGTDQVDTADRVLGQQLRDALVAGGSDLDRVEQSCEAG
ncbi:hypothetical protein [Nocardioides acrostichi]|uniref:Uncharacterized protein n=1 Tax=Nocardioides acrostichi TaxID=2784339 RepID=A0A930Y5N5_9ACTN|nr:hypothetical protein [Nocardioides acrostichi]MBF4160086.1 hypothetical protein [Nocardioides acrostichi]